MKIYILDIIGEDTTMSTVQAATKGLKDGEPLDIYINSIGGRLDEGLAIYDYLRHIKAKKTVYIFGSCKSIATVIALSAPVRVISKHSDVSFHLPEVSASINREALPVVNDALEGAENRLIQVYVKELGGSPAEWLQLLKGELQFNSADAVKYGFATQIVNQIEKQQDMKIRDILLGKKTEIVNKIVQDATGKEIDFPDVADGTPVKVGDAANIEGSAAPDGLYMLPNNQYLYIEGGKVSALLVEDKGKEGEEVATPATQEDVMPDNKEIEDKIKQLSSDLLEAKGRLEAVDNLVKEVGEIRALITSGTAEVTPKERVYTQDGVDRQLVIDDVTY